MSPKTQRKLARASRRALAHKCNRQGGLAIPSWDEVAENVSLYDHFSTYDHVHQRVGLPWDKWQRNPNRKFTLTPREARKCGVVLKEIHRGAPYWAPKGSHAWRLEQWEIVGVWPQHLFDGPMAGEVVP